tara:strand:- start:32866 stop:34554 length:1689 start_codon:yes stop_codon:yes gene_type:complete
MVRSFLLLLFALFIWNPSAHAQDTERLESSVTKALEYFIDGINDFENQDYEEALDKLIAAQLLFSEDAGINYALSDVYAAVGDFVNAAYYGQIATDLEPENKWYLLHLADVYRASGRNELAVETLQRVLEIYPNDQDVLYTLSESYLEFGELEKSNDVLDKLINITGGMFELHIRKFQNYNALGQNENALSELEKIRELNPGNLTTLHTISQYYLEADDLEGAESILMEARERKPGEPTTLLLLAEIYTQNREWEKLGRAFMEMIEDPMIGPDQKIELARFVFAQSLNYPEEEVLQQQSEQIILALSENEPDYGPAQLIAADYFLQRNEFETALEVLERVNRTMPDQSEAWGQRIQLLFTLSRYEEVISLSESASNYAPDNSFIQFFTGAAYMLTHQYEEAEEWLQNATLSPSQRTFRSVIYGTLGDVKNELGKWDESVDSFQNALRLDRNNHNALNNYAYYLSLRNENMDEALEMSKRAVEMEPQNASYLDTLGWIYYKKGDFEQALEYIQQAVATGNASAEVYEHLGDVYEALGELNNARISWEKAFELDPEKTHLMDQL